MLKLKSKLTFAFISAELMFVVPEAAFLLIQRLLTIGSAIVLFIDAACCRVFLHRFRLIFKQLIPDLFTHCFRIYSIRFDIRYNIQVDSRDEKNL